MADFRARSGTDDRLLLRVALEPMLEPIPTTLSVRKQAASLFVLAKRVFLLD
jgi:hypothetical protein